MGGVGKGLDMKEQQSSGNSSEEKAEGWSCQESLFQEHPKETTGETELEKWTERVENGESGSG